MAQQIIPADQLVPKFQGIGRCNNYVVLQSIPCSPECKIIGKILLDHPLSYALTATADIPAMYLQYKQPQCDDGECGSVRGMLIPDAFLTGEIHATNDFKEYETGQKQAGEGEKAEQSYDDVDDSDNKLEPMSHKENPEHVDDDDDKEEEKVDEKEGNGMGSLEIRTEKMQTPIPTTPRSPRINLSSDKNIAQVLMDTVSLLTPTTSKDPHKQIRISSKYNHLLGALHRMCIRQGYMIRDMERKCVTTSEFWKVHKKVDQVLHEIVPQLVERATEDLIENNLKPCIAETIIEDRDAF
ncbi:hypothetical protein Tco_0726001 [Tanacetum coccineum]|uniref:Uncharacterized protein n=1 Tax=Tanacetum coccineum TaxID=301880 RepID=A0ABQ4YGP0_9ASTR